MDCSRWLLRAAKCARLRGSAAGVISLNHLRCRGRQNPDRRLALPGKKENRTHL